MINVLLYVSTILIVLGLCGYIFLYLINNKVDITEESGFNVSKDVINDYEDINIIQTTGMVSYYNIKRRVIRLSSKDYYGKTTSNLAISLMESGISVIHKNKYKVIDYFSFILSNLKVLYILPIISLIINFSSYNVSDAKATLLFGTFITLISYLYINILLASCDIVSKKINKLKYIDNSGKKKIIKYFNNVILFNKLMLYGEILVLVRMIFILLGI